jgi:hypothetical protein
MRVFVIAAVLTALSGMAVAQQPEMPPVDRDLWQAMQQAFSNLSMPLQAHQQIQNIMQGVEQQAMQRKAQRDAAQAKQETKP